jgi:hypothetical protein
VQASLDRDTRQLTLTLRAVDPNTGWLPEDPLVGLLSLTTTPAAASGLISYRVARRPASERHRDHQPASIVFDFNDLIETRWSGNTLDAAGPTSRVEPPRPRLSTHS